MAGDDEAVDGLYALPLDEFTQARNELAKRLRSEGDRDAAAQVRALKKPSAAAWAVNQVVRSRPKERDALLAAGERLRDVHERLAAGKAGADELRDAAAAERSALAELMDAARGLLGGRGGFLSQPVLDRVEETLQATTVDEEARAGVESGRLERERRAAALGALGAAAPVESPRRAKAKKAPRPPAKEPERSKQPEQPRAKPQADREAEREAARAAREREAERKRQLAELRKAARSAEAELERLGKRAEKAERRREQAEAAAADAREEEKDARKRVRELERELGRARREIERLGG